MRTGDPINLFTQLTGLICSLGRIAENLWWSRDAAAGMLFTHLSRRMVKENINKFYKPAIS